MVVLAQARGDAGLAEATEVGFDIAARGRMHTLPEAEAALGRVDQAEEALARRVGGLDGVLLERKRYSLAVHYRRVDRDAVVDAVVRAVESVRAETGLRKRQGKKVLELEPDVDWDKGRALKWLVDVLLTDGGEQPFIVYMGDDETDEDAFAVLRQDGAGIRVGEEIAPSLADYRVADQAEVLQALRALRACVR